MYLVELVSLFSLDTYAGVKLLDHDSPILSFVRNLYTVFHSSHTNNIPTNSVGGFPFLHILANICYFGPF